MRTDIQIDDDLMRAAMAASGASTEGEAVEEALKLMVQIRGQRKLLELKGKLNWEGDLEAMRLD